MLSTRQQEQYVPDSERLEEMVPRLLNDFKHTLVKQQVNALLQQMRSPGFMSDPQHAQEVMKEYMEMCAIERQFAQILGDRVVMA